jgi:hypothetical protein
MRPLGLALSVLLLAACATSTRYELASPSLGGARNATGYAPYTPARVNALQLEKDNEVILATDPAIYHDCAKMTPAQRVKWPVCRGRLW